jgi:hypothetical protein
LKCQGSLIEAIQHVKHAPARDRDTDMLAKLPNGIIFWRNGCGDNHFIKSPCLTSSFHDSLQHRFATDI